LNEEGLQGNAMALKVPEKILIGFQGIVASSDTAIIDQSKKVLDLAGEILRRENLMKSLVVLRRKRGYLGRG
jgi:hypothetical protein